MKGFTVVALAWFAGGCDGVFGLTHLQDPETSDARSDDGKLASCPSTYDRMIAGSESHYRVVQEKQPWAVAARSCAGDAPGLTHLIVLSDQPELTSLILDKTTFVAADTWVGVTSAKNGNNDFQWVTDEDTMGFVVPAMTSKPPWESGQPDDNIGAGELRGAQDPAPGSLHDENPSDSSFYICECDGWPNIPSHYQ